MRPHRQSAVRPPARQPSDRPSISRPTARPSAAWPYRPSVEDTEDGIGVGEQRDLPFAVAEVDHDRPGSEPAVEPRSDQQKVRLVPRLDPPQRGPERTSTEESQIRAFVRGIGSERRRAASGPAISVPGSNSDGRPANRPRTTAQNEAIPSSNQ